MKPSIDYANLQASVFALLNWKKLQASQNLTSRQQIQENDDFLYLILTLKNVLAKPLHSISHKIPLPNTLQPLPNICLIIGDGPKNSSHKLTVETVQKKIKSEDIPVSKVIKLAKLRSLLDNLDSKQKFCDAHDLFLADERIIGLLPNVLGKGFYKKKVPVPVSLKARIDGGLSLKEEVEKACCCELLRFGSGTCHTVRVGESLMEGMEIVENVRAAIDGAVEFVPKKWKGVAALHLKFSGSLSMPIYVKDQKSYSSVI